MIYYLGTHKPHWLSLTDVPMLISRRNLAYRKTLPVARGAWALDSGSFTELDLHGGWQTDVPQYTNEILRFQEEIGKLEWAAPKDWSCEPRTLEKTGLTVGEHQVRTVSDYVELRQNWPRGHACPVIPVLQGWTIQDYIACIDQYRAQGIDLTQEPLVGVGSLCRRQRTKEVAGIIMQLSGRGLKMHGFGIKAAANVRSLLTSADSASWSYQARMESVRLPGHSHKCCNNCLDYALKWLDDFHARPTRSSQGALL